MATELRIPIVTVFAYNSIGQALEIANQTVEETLVAEIRIMGPGFTPAEKAVAWIVIPADRPLVRKDTLHNLTDYLNGLGVPEAT